MKNLLFAFTFLTFLSFQTKAQDDLSGWYVDGVKADKISCYGFKNLQMVVPYNSEWAAYTNLSVKVYTENKNSESPDGEGYGGVKLISLSSINSYIKGKYLVINLFSQGEAPQVDIFAGSRNNANDGIPVLPDGREAYWIEYKLPRWQLKHDPSNAKKHATPSTDLTLNFHIFGLTQTGIKEEYQESCKCIKKNPTYSSSKLTKTYKLLCTNREFLSRKENFNTAFFTDPCVVPGTKVDFNTLGKSGGSSTSNSNSNSTSTNNTSVKTETPVKTSGTTGKTIITTVAPTSATAVKPLDKTKLGYFEEKSDDKKFMYRNGYQTSPGTYHGEVREYDNNTLEKIITYTNGVEDGLYVIFSDGKVEWAGTYKNGKKDGAWKHYKNGVLEDTEKYVDGEKQ